VSAAQQAYAVFRCVQHRDLISKIIVATTCREGGEVAHAELVLRGGTIIGAFAEGGVRERPLDYDGGLANVEFEQLIAIPVDAATLDAIEHFMRSPRVLGEKYDYTGLGDFVQYFDWHEGHQVFCSALCVDAARWVKILKHGLPIHAHGVTPVMWQQMLLCRDDSIIITRDDPIFLAHIAPISGSNITEQTGN
jgi:hypothetical protein